MKKILTISFIILLWALNSCNKPVDNQNIQNEWFDVSSNIEVRTLWEAKGWFSWSTTVVWGFSN